MPYLNRQSPELKFSGLVLGTLLCLTSFLLIFGLKKERGVFAGLALFTIALPIYGLWNVERVFQAFP